MVLCYLCRTNVPTMLVLKLRFEVYHENVKLVKCIEHGCNRSFQLFNSFKRHHLNSHSSSYDDSAHVPNAKSFNIHGKTYVVLRGPV